MKHPGSRRKTGEHTTRHEGDLDNYPEAADVKLLHQTVVSQAVDGLDEVGSPANRLIVARSESQLKG
jgi:hypothetical protein